MRYIYPFDRPKTVANKDITDDDIGLRKELKHMYCVLCNRVGRLFV